MFSNLATNQQELLYNLLVYKDHVDLAEATEAALRVKFDSDQPIELTLADELTVAESGEKGYSQTLTGSLVAISTTVNQACKSITLVSPAGNDVVYFTVDSDVEFPLRATDSSEGWVKIPIRHTNKIRVKGTADEIIKFSVGG